MLAASETNAIAKVICSENFSDLQKLLRVTAYVLRAVKQFKTKKSSRANLSTALTPEEISASKLLWISHVQEELIQQRDFSTLKMQLKLFCDEKGLWRCGGRLQNADIPYAVKHPILLPRSHHFTILVVKDAHV